MTMHYSDADLAYVESQRAKRLQEEAQEALQRMDARKGEDVNVWALRLGRDLSKFTD